MGYFFLLLYNSKGLWPNLHQISKCVAMPQHFRQNIRLQIAVITLGLVLITAKVIAWWLTNSNAILTDALEGIINILAGIFALYSLVLAAKPSDENHPYGHGKVEFISVGFEGGLIFLAGLLIIGKAIYNLFYPQPLGKLDIGILLTAGTGFINFILGFLLERQGKRSRSLVLVADGKHLKSDAYSSIGLIVGLLLIYFSNITWIDNLTAILFGGIIIYTGFRLLRTSVAGIMDEADYQLISGLVHFLAKNRQHNWIDVHNFRVIKYGATLHIDCHLTLPWYFSTLDANQEVKAFENLLATNVHGPTELFVHIDPCEPPANCLICKKIDCDKRQALFQMDIQWTLENLMKNQKHHA